MDDSSVTVYMSTPYVSGREPEYEDYIARITRDNVSGKFEIAVLEKTQDFGMKFLNPFINFHIVAQALINIWNIHKYDQEYISYLLELIDKEEFIQRAEKLAKAFDVIDKDLLSQVANLILNIFNQPLTSAELSLFLNVDPSALDSATVHLLEYNPENIESE